ncbi:ATPase [Brevibacterium luteolum]|uniref:ATPase n=2 Tax=Brevibacterium luteolum TaxID=199591 RepID=A0A6G8KVH6_9MICO|nr:ATPase [Brevibacterium luteolum]QIN28623.1 ATPase [Brevibacterium luteolum]
MEQLIIDRSIDINASAHAVFTLISQPGWFINDGELRDHTVTHRDDLAFVTDPVHGTFVIRTVELRPPHFAAFRWTAGEPLDTPNDAVVADDLPMTLIEFFITERRGGVTLRVRETGFENLDADGMAQRTYFDANDSGWREELALAKAALEQAAGPCADAEAEEVR